jgi:hypothetical protein
VSGSQIRHDGAFRFPVQAVLPSPIAFPLHTLSGGRSKMATCLKKNKVHSSLTRLN